MEGGGVLGTCCLRDIFSEFCSTSLKKTGKNQRTLNQRNVSYLVCRCIASVEFVSSFCPDDFPHKSFFKTKVQGTGLNGPGEIHNHWKMR